MEMGTQNGLQDGSGNSTDRQLTLSINWSGDISHVLVTVNNQDGQLNHIFFLTSSDVTREISWDGFSRSEMYTVRVHGLKQHVVTRQARTQIYPVYSIEAVQEEIMSPNVLSPGQEHTMVVNFSKAYGNYKMLDSLGSQDDFKVRVSHSPPMAHSLISRFPHDTTSGLYIIYNERLKKEYLMTSSVAIFPSVSIHDTVPLLPICHSRTIYKVRAIALNNTRQYSFGHPSVVCQTHLPCGISKVLTIKSCMSKEDLQKLMDKAKSYCRSNSRRPATYTIKHFYRNKPRRYYDDILQNRSGLMEKYIKDNNGDPYSPINNKINGLFFSASLDTRTMRPPPFSYFGELRLFVPAEEIFTDDTRMYFTDFFCHIVIHYVTVVLTKRGSHEDRFCQSRLLELDPRNNPFFTVTEEGSYWFQSNRRPPFRQPVVLKTFRMVSVKKFHVEFLYTENLDIHNRYMYFDFVEGRGVSKANGIPKRASCQICNLDLSPVNTLPPIGPR